MHRIAIIQVSDYMSYYYDDNGVIPSEAISNWEEVTDEEYQMLMEESQLRNENRNSGNHRIGDKFMVIKQEPGVRQFIENTVGARLEEVRRQKAEREAEAEAKRQKAREAAEKKRMAAEAKERAEFLKLAKKFGNPAAVAAEHAQMDLLS